METNAVKKSELDAYQYLNLVHATKKAAENTCSIRPVSTTKLSNTKECENLREPQREKSETNTLRQIKFNVYQYQNTGYNIRTVTDDTYNVKTVKLEEENNQKKYENLKERLKVFSGIRSIEEAKAIAKEFLPIDKEKNYVKIGNAICVIISRSDLLELA